EENWRRQRSRQSRDRHDTQRRGAAGHHRGHRCRSRSAGWVPAEIASFSILFHSASLTGITDRREMRTSGNVLNDGSALISASVTGRSSFLTGATSTTAALPLL